MNAIAKLTLTPLTQNKLTVLVLGGYGFIGRHIVTELKALNASVLIGTRRQNTALSPANERHIMLHRLNSDPTWLKQLKGVDVVINAVGILRQRRRESYEQVHHQAVIELASACAEREIRFVHISALGLNNAVKSRFLSSKLLGEQALAKSDADWHLIRPSLVDGEEGYGAQWFRRMASWPLHFVPHNASGVIAPIKASDLGKAVAIIAVGRENAALGRRANRIYELGGQIKMSLRQYLNVLRTQVKPSLNTAAVCVNVPAILSRLLSHVCDLCHLTPFSFGHYELLKYNNLPAHNRLKELLIEYRRYKRSMLASHDLGKQVVLP